MTPATIAEITIQRVSQWAQKVIDEHATPVLMLSVGHDHHSGTVVVSSCEETDDAELLLWLHGAQQLLTKKIAAEHMAHAKAATAVTGEEGTDA